MAERRMFAKTIIDSDLFLDMPSSTQCLYFHLSMRADDDGFINNPKKIQRFIGSSDDDLKLLIAKNFIIPFDSGVVVIKHWKIHNYIQKDRYKPTLYQQELEQLEVDRSKNYQIKLENSKCIHHVYIPDTSGIPLVDKTDTQVRLGKDSIELDKNNIDIYTEDGNVDKYVNESKNLKNISRLYEQNIGLINGVTGEWLIEISEKIESGLFKRAIEIATDSNKCTLGYVKGIIKKWLEKDITTLDKLEAYKLQQNQKEVDSDVRRGKGNLKNEGPTNDPESEATRRRELLRQIEELERDEL